MSQKETILKHLSTRATITPLEAHHLYGIYRLSEMIRLLRKDGYKITTLMKTAPNGTKYGEYRLHSQLFEKTQVKVPVSEPKEMTDAA